MNGMQIGLGIHDETGVVVGRPAVIKRGCILKRIQDSKNSTRSPERIARHLQRHPNLFIREPLGTNGLGRRNGQLWSA